MKIYDEAYNIYDAVDAVVEYGFAAIEGTTTPAVAYAKRVIRCLSVYSETAATIDFVKVSNAGYLYFVYDRNKYNFSEAKSLVTKIDAANPFD